MLKACFALFAFLCAGGQLSAQCERVGWVTSVMPGCGARIIDLDNGDLLLAVNGTDDLSVYQTISFNADSAVLPNGCKADGLEIVGLTCVSDVLPCVSQFVYATSSLNAFSLTFDADIYDASAQTCAWTFGDGATATGKNVQHTFPQEGNYPVCLTVSDANGCAKQHCKEIYVSAQNPNSCDYEIYVTAINGKLYGKIFPSISTPGVLNSVTWYDSKSNKVLAETPDFSYNLPGYGNYTICAQYVVIDSISGSTCTTTRCQQLTLADPACVNPSMKDLAGFCQSIYAPVCGCNGITYGNECEAMTAGVSTWWAGECGASTGSCNADLQIDLVNGDPNTGYVFKFTNLAYGDFSSVQLDFGDGSALCENTQWDTVLHHYEAGGVYRTNLTAWKNNSCVSSVTKLLITDAYFMAPENLPEGTDYVMPGDANGDKKANVYDLLNIGLGYSTIGAPRPNATTAWTPQFAPNWTQNVTNGVNFKHLDCDGDGKILDFDADPVEQHYVPIDTNDLSWLPGAPTIRVEFDEDTIYVNPNSSNALEISANVRVGNSGSPVFDLFGLAFTLRYPEYVDHDPESFYYNDLMGPSTHCLFMAKDNYNQRQLDMGFARKNGLGGVNGHGRIAKINFATDFIIIVDIVGRADNDMLPFTIPVKGLKAIDAAGNIKELSAPVEQDTVWIKLLETTGAGNPELDRQLAVFPNPATDAATLFTGNLEVNQIDVLNALGQTISTLSPSGANITRLKVKDWSKGLYTLRVQTENGVAEKKLLVK